MEKKEQDPERMEFQDEEDLDEMEEKEARGSTRGRTRALPGGPKMLEEDQDMTDDGCCGEKRTPDYKEERGSRGSKMILIPWHMMKLGAIKDGRTN